MLSVLNGKQVTRLNGSQLELYQRYVRGSDCNVVAHRSYKDGGLLSVEVGFSGELSAFASTANARVIRWRGFGKARRPFIGKNDQQLAKLEAARFLYEQELCRKQMPAPAFNRTKTIALLMLPRTGRRFDSHNYTKSICDWFEAVGLIDDDSLMEAHAIKREDYDALAGDELHMIIQRADETKSLMQETFLEFLQSARGEVRLIG